MFFSIKAQLGPTPTSASGGAFQIVARYSIAARCGNDRKNASFPGPASRHDDVSFGPHRDQRSVKVQRAEQANVTFPPLQVRVTSVIVTSPGVGVGDVTLAQVGQRFAQHEVGLFADLGAVQVQRLQVAHHCEQRRGLVSAKQCPLFETATSLQSDAAGHALFGKGKQTTVYQKNPFPARNQTLKILRSIYSAYKVVNVISYSNRTKTNK